ncbi:class I SAM-dependent methyltransferase [Alteromonas sp. a30]|uniref:class I SAM-dependent methyltransferase n=1 Tax=Alteromonas sp. a30 TaxID=2730917 RepID=UPI00228005C3|nr:hypothetical protein [Alteromonas sp. a30]MCY7296739.1 class I SAM-dependent methyltransferase [Alteromonas sp. a30]
MKKRLIFVAAVALAASNYLSAAPYTEQQLTQLLSHQDRPAEDAKRDYARKPAKVMAFTGIEKGDHILDLFAGSGWYTELFSHAVGAEGKVYAQNDEVIWRFAKDGLIERTEDNRLANVSRFDGMPIVDIDVPDNSLDIVFTALNYHDLFFTETKRNGKASKVRDEVVDYKAALSHVKKAMKDDGVFVIVDHFAKPGSGYEAANTVHRIDPDIVKYQMQQMGFELLEEAFYLRNPDDDLSKSVFDPELRGKTSRFIYKFGKK